jgi:hypothetical protein
MLISGWNGNTKDSKNINVDEDGNVYVVDKHGLVLPYHDKQVIDETLSPATIVITYSLEGVDLATKTISVSGTIITITVSRL